MNKTIVIIGVAVAVAIAAYVLLGNQGTAQAPIVDPVCGEGYELVGEGCMTHQEACELQGDGYRYHEDTERCDPSNAQ